MSGIAYAMAPDDVKVELVEMKAQAAPIASHHIHFARRGAEGDACVVHEDVRRPAGTSANPAAFVSADSARPWA